MNTTDYKIEIVTDSERLFSWAALAIQGRLSPMSPAMVVYISIYGEIKMANEGPLSAEKAELLALLLQKAAEQLRGAGLEPEPPLDPNDLNDDDYRDWLHDHGAL